LKKTGKLLARLKLIHEDLQDTAAAKARCGELTDAPESTNVRLQLADEITDLQTAFRSGTIGCGIMHSRIFHNAGEGRMLCALYPDVRQQFVADCNTSWSESVHHVREDLLGMKLCNLFTPATFVRFQGILEVLQRQGCIVLRNMPVYRSGNAYDMILWLEPPAISATSSQGDRLSAGSQPKGFVQIVMFNARPLPQALLPSIATLHDVSALSDSISPQSSVGSCNPCSSPAASLSSATAVPTALVRDQCGILMAMNSTEDVGETVIVVPWSSDLSDSSSPVPFITATRGQISQLVPADLLSLHPELITPCGSESRFLSAEMTSQSPCSSSSMDLIPSKTAPSIDISLCTSSVIPMPLTPKHYTEETVLYHKP